MKAKEVLRRYAAGDRNFCNASLRGANFKGQNLSGADFSRADIRSANFTDAILQQTSFAMTKAGLQRRWLVVQWLLIAMISVVSGLSQGLLGAMAAFYSDPNTFSTPLERAVGLGTYLLLVAFTYVAIMLQGFSIRVFSSILGAIVCVLTFTLIGTFLFLDVLAGAFAVTFAGTGADIFASASGGIVAFTFAFTFIVTGAVTGAVAVTVTNTVAGIRAVIGICTFSFLCAVAGAVMGASVFTVPVVFSVTSTVTGTGSLFSFFIGWRVLEEDETFNILRVFSLVLTAVGGTTFSGADLTNATFSQAKLKSTNFANSQKNNTLLTHVYWNKAKQLNYVRVGTSILQDRRVQALLTTPEKGYKQNLTNVNLREANLSGVTLDKANLTHAILSGALLKSAMLKDVVLTEAQAVSTDFTGACLTGATLESWNIDSTTIFKDIDCDYVYLLEHPKENDNRERRPHDIKQMFQPGDFEKLFKEVQDDVQLLIRNGANPTALRAAFQKIRENYPDLPDDAFQGFQRRDKDFLVTVKVPQSIDKGQFQRDWDSGYHAGLQAGREESAALLASAEKRADGLEAIALTMAQNPLSIQNTQNMTDNDHSQTIEVKGNMDSSVIGQGDLNHLTNQNQPTSDSEP